MARNYSTQTPEVKVEGNMLKYKDKIFDNRRDLKEYLGGTNAYNRAFKDGTVEFINEPDKIIASNDRGQGI